jgi:anti-sigma B factor antagonist
MRRRLAIRKSTARSQHDPSALHIDVHPQRQSVRVAVAGELDLANAGALQAQLDALRDHGFTDVVLDLRELEFMDSSGVALILGEGRRARGAGQRFSLVAGRTAVQRALRLCGVADELEFAASAPPPPRRIARSPSPRATFERAHRAIALQCYLAELRQQGRAPRRTVAPPL